MHGLSVLNLICILPFRSPTKSEAGELRIHDSRNKEQFVYIPSSVVEEELTPRSWKHYSICAEFQDYKDFIGIKNRSCILCN